MKKALCAFVLALSCVVVVAPAAEADTNRCVTRAEFRSVHQGMAKGRVHRVFDVRGRRVAFAKIGRYTSEVRRYRPCSRRTAISVSYANGRLDAKSRVRLRRR
jgi:hypothetical protein